VIFLGPVVATALLWTRLEKAGAALMAVTMAGAFVFGAINHFVLPGSDNVLEMQLGQWAESLFVVSAIGLGLIEAGGMAWGFMALKHMRALSR
jgi:Na+/proline symporter